MDLLLFSYSKPFICLIDTLIYIFESIYSLKNKNFLIIETSEDNYIITNRTRDVIKNLKINSSFYTIIIKNYVFDHLKSYSYYSTFSLLLFLKLVEKSHLLIKKWGNKQLIAKYFEKTNENIIVIIKEMKILLNEKQIFQCFIKGFNNNEDFIEENRLIQDILSKFDEKYRNNKIIIKIIYYLSSKEMTGSYLEQGFALKFNQNHTNIDLIIEHYQTQLDQNQNYTFLKYDNDEFLLLQSENLSFETEIVESFINISNIIEAITENGIKIILTNGYLTDLLTFSFFSKKIMIIGNVKIKYLRNISQFLEKNMISLSEMRLNLQKNYQKKSELLKNSFEIKISMNALEKLSYFFIIRKNISNIMFFNIFLPFVSEPKSRKTKNFIKSSIAKFRKLLKYKKYLIGGGAFELELVEFFKNRTITKNTTSESRFIKEQINEAVSDVFKELFEKMMRNEGFDYNEIEKKSIEIRKIGNPEIFYDEYKGKKFAINHAFFNLRIILKTSFFI